MKKIIMRNQIVITGASGWLASALISRLESEGKEVIALTSDPSKIDGLYGENVIVFSNKDALMGIVDFSKSGVVVHTAFCRRNNGTELAKSLTFTKDILKVLKDNGVERCINISSQAVYGAEERELPTEDDEVNPSYLYAMAKYAEELLVEQIYSDGQYVNLRTASIIGVWNGIPDNVVSKMIRQALKGEKIRIIGGQQKFSFIDIHDVVNIIDWLINYNIHSMENAVNCGPNLNVSLSTIVDDIESLMVIYELDWMGCEVIDKKEVLNAGMNCRSLYSQMSDYTPKSFEKILKEEFDYIQKYEVIK